MKSLTVVALLVAGVAQAGKPVCVWSDIPGQLKVVNGKPEHVAAIECRQKTGDIVTVSSMSDDGNTVEAVGEYDCRSFLSRQTYPLALAIPWTGDYAYWSKWYCGQPGAEAAVKVSQARNFALLASLAKLTQASR